MRSGNAVQTAVQFVSACIVVAAASAGAMAQAPSASGKPPSAASAATESQTQAREILMRMAQFLAKNERFSVQVQAGYDAVQPSGQKIEFSETRSVTLSRPNRLRVEGGSSDGSKVLTVFTGKEIMLIDHVAGVYATTPQPGGIDETVKHFVGELGMRLPLAVLLLSELPQELQARVQTVDYVERTSLHGAPVHHLAARTETVDFQVWVADGDKPLPQRIVITYKHAEGQPQFRAQLSGWNLAPAISDATFNVKPPQKAQKIAFAAQLGRPALGAAAKPTDAKGATKP
jgi:hypothetical protein